MYNEKTNIDNTHLPEDVKAFLHRIESSAEYVYRTMIDRYTIECNGEKVGGVDTKKMEWYFSKVFVEKHEVESVMERYGFTFRIHNKNINKSHTYWALKGQDSCRMFEEAMTEICGVKIKLWNFC